MYLGLQDAVQEDVIVTCIEQHPDYNPGVTETPVGSGTMRTGKKRLEKHMQGLASQLLISAGQSSLL